MAEITHDAEDGFHEIHLSGKQLVFLFMTTTIVLVFVFLCGVLVGRGVRDAGPGDPAGALAATAGADLTEPSPRAAEPPHDPEGDTLTYDDRLRGDAKPAELEKPKPEPPPAPPAQPAQRAAVPAERPAASIAPDVPTSGRPGRHVVQVFASQDPQAASSLVKRLAAKGYPAFLVAPTAREIPAMYRVHVGRYSDRRDAEEVRRRLQKEEQFSPWISSR